MAQMSWRADDRLMQRVKRAAAASDRSLNEFVTLVLDAATDPASAGSEAEAVRERLRHAGLLAAATPAAAAVRPPKAAVAAAARRAVRGTPLAELVVDGR